MSTVTCEASGIPHPMTATCEVPAPAAAPEACYVCGRGPHGPVELHTYWPVSEAAAEFARQPSGSMPSMTAAETLDPREAVYE